MFKNIGNGLYRPVILPASVSSENKEGVGPGLSNVSSVSNTAVPITRRELPDECQTIYDEENSSYYANLKNYDCSFLESDKWETMRCSGHDLEQITASYKDTNIMVQTNWNDKPVFTYVEVSPPIDPGIKFDSLEDLFRFVKQREDVASTRGSEAQSSSHILF